MMEKQKTRRLSKFKTKLILLVMLPVVPALLLSLFQNHLQRKSERARVEDGLAGLSKLVAAHENSLIKNARQLLDTLSQFPFLVLATNRQFVDVHLQNLLKLSPDYLTFGIIESNGYPFSSSLPFTNGTYLGDRSYFKRALDSKRFSVGDYQVGTITGQPSLNFGLPIRETNGHIVRVVFASLRLNLLTDAASQIPLTPGASVTILDRSGTVVARHPDPETWIGKPLASHPMVAAALRTQDGIAESEGLDGIRRVYAVASISDGFEPCLFVAIGVPTQVLYSSANRLMRNSLVTMAVVALVGLAATSYVARKSLVEPVEALAKAAHQISEGNFKLKADTNIQTEEFQELAETFDLMAENLEKRETELTRARNDIQQMNEALEQRVRERTEKLAEANKELESFSYSVSHDLRAPLRHLDGFAQLLLAQQKDRLDDKGKRHLAIVSDSAKKMGTLIDDLLSFSRMGRLEMLKNTIDSNRLVQEVIASLKPSVEARSIDWLVHELPAIQGDAAMLRQVWSNLISNALKYSRTKEVARIEIGCDKCTSEHIFFVKDNGVGFDMAFKEKLFGVFQRLHHESQFEGTGIGLANVRRIIHRHGGRVWADSTPGQGATFYFAIPA